MINGKFKIIFHIFIYSLCPYITIFYYNKLIFDSSILNLRKLQENKTYSEIKISINNNDSYINPNFALQPYAEYIDNKTI